MKRYVKGYTREQIRAFGCPKCGAEPHQRCTNKSGKLRASNHFERMAFAQRLLHTQPKPLDELERESSLVIDEHDRA